MEKTKKIGAVNDRPYNHSVYSCISLISASKTGRLFWIIS